MQLSCQFCGESEVGWAQAKIQKLKAVTCMKPEGSETNLLVQANLTKEEWLVERVAQPTWMRGCSLQLRSATKLSERRHRRPSLSGIHGLGKSGTGSKFLNRFLGITQLTGCDQSRQ